MVGLVLFAKYAFDESQKTTHALEAQIKEMSGEQRPWVGLQGPIQLPIPKFNEDYTVQLSFANSGKTPAVKVRATFTLYPPLPVAKHPDIPSEPCPESECGGGEVLIPNNPITRRFGLSKDEMTGFAINDVIAARSLLWLMGRIDYEEMPRPHDNGIKEAPPHRTVLCYNIDWSRPTIPSFKACNLPHSNDAN